MAWILRAKCSDVVGHRGIFFSTIIFFHSLISFLLQKEVSHQEDAFFSECTVELHQMYVTDEVLQKDSVEIIKLGECCSATG